MNRDHKLEFIEHLSHRGYQLKTARRGAMMMVLIYSPGAVLATLRVVDTMENYEKAIQAAPIFIDSDAIESLVPLANNASKSAPLNRMSQVRVS